MIETLFFYFFAATAIAAALYVVTSKEPARAALALLITMFSLGAFFVLLRAYFIAMVHILVYAGAIIVMFLFVLMLLGLKREDLEAYVGEKFIKIGGLIVSIVLGLQIIMMTRVFMKAPLPVGQRLEGTIEVIGKALYTDYVIPFEVASLLLLVGIVGAVVLAKKED